MGDEPPLVSVVIPSRERPRVVQDAVRSALAQRGVRVEVCVVDDGSDPPLQLPPDLASDGRVSVVRHRSARGPAAARNAGLRETTGALVAFLDDDDVWLAGKLARQVEALRADGPGTVMAACGFELWDGRELIASVLPSPAVNHGALLAHPCLWPSTVLVRRETIEAAGGFDESLRRVEDWETWLRISDRGRIACLPEVLVDRRWSPLPLPAARAARSAIAQTLEARLARLPPRDAARLRARRQTDDGVLLARLGRRSEALSLLLTAWRAHPGRPRAALGVARVLAGERAWHVVARAAAPARARLRRRPPRPPGQAPGWADP